MVGFTERKGRRADRTACAKALWLESSVAGTETARVRMVGRMSGLSTGHIMQGCRQITDFCLHPKCKEKQMKYLSKKVL